MNLNQFVLAASSQCSFEEQGELDDLSPTEAQRLLTEFNRSVDQLIDQHGVDSIGKAVWHVYGCVGDTARDALSPIAESGFGDFYDSLTDLYDLGFAKHCEDAAGHSDRGGNNLATACYMFWDMDSGLEHLTLRGRPELFSYAEQLIDFGLSHKHAAVQESFLHCLGHLHAWKASFVEGRISRFIKRTDISKEIRQYAQQCGAGYIM